MKRIVMPLLILIGMLFMGCSSSTTTKKKPSNVDIRANVEKEATYQATKDDIICFDGTTKVKIIKKLTKRLWTKYLVTVVCKSVRDTTSHLYECTYYHSTGEADCYFQCLVSRENWRCY